MVNISVLFILASSFSALAVPTTEHSTDQLKKSLIILGKELTTLDKSLNDYPQTGGTLRGAVGIHADAGHVVDALTQCAGDTNDIVGIVGEKDANDILASVEGLEPIIVNALHAAIAKKQAFSDLPLGNIPLVIRVDLKELDDHAIVLGTRLISICPDDLKSKANVLKTNIHNAFAEARAAYA